MFFIENIIVGTGENEIGEYEYTSIEEVEYLRVGYSISYTPTPFIELQSQNKQIIDYIDNKEETIKEQLNTLNSISKVEIRAFDPEPEDLFEGRMWLIKEPILEIDTSDLGVDVAANFSLNYNRKSTIKYVPSGNQKISKNRD